MARKKDLGGRGELVGVFGPFGERSLVVLPTSEAQALVDADVIDAAPVRIVEAARRDVERLRKRAPELADSALAASAEAMAMEIANPYNSATSKSMCAKALREALDRLQELVPPKVEGDRLDEVNRKREDRRRRRASA